MNKRVIKISNQKFFYTNDDFVTLSQTNFPEGDVSFKTEGPYKDIYWEADIVSFDKLNKSLKLSVINYSPDDITSFENQKANEHINMLIFENLEWNQLQHFLSSYIRSSLLPLMSERSKSEYYNHINNEPTQTPTPSTNIFSTEYDRNSLILSESDNHISDNFIDDENESPVLSIQSNNNFNSFQTLTYKEEFRFPIKDIEFSQGFVSIHKIFDFYNSKIELKIYNNNVRPEYNHIKNYLPKIFKRKTFSIAAEIKIKRHEIINIQANSPEIDALNGDLINTIKQNRIQRATKIDFNPELKKGLFTADELFSKNDTLKQAGNFFKQNEEDIIKSILIMKDIRNKRQLEYLSGYNLTEKILFTPNPHFGFLFLIKGSKKNHFCWELLNSHATYLWSFEKNNSSENQLNRIEEIISIIQEKGRNNYKTDVQQSELDNNIKFNNLNHIRIESKTEDSFNIWKQELIELIV